MSKLKFFQSCKTIQELKIEFRKLAKLNHPDLFQSELEKQQANETMKAIISEYEILMKALPRESNNNTQYDNETEEQFNLRVSKEMQEIINNISHLPFTIEIIGTWLWISGDTRPYKSYLTAYNFLWSPIKKMYYWRLEKDSMGKGYKGKGKDIDDIRNTHGSTKVNNTYRPILT